MPSKSTIRQNRYDNDHTVRYTLKLNTTTDNDIIEAIEEIVKIHKVSKQGAIKGLIRAGVTTPVTITIEKRD